MGIDAMPRFDLMRQEHEAWLQAMSEWRASPVLSGIDLNSDAITPFIKAIEVWGERLVQLRLTQSDVDQVHALTDKLAMYDAIRRSAAPPK